MSSIEVDVVLLPRDLTAAHTDGRAVVVFDVLRATTSMTAALAAGVTEIRIFGDVDSAAAAAREAGEGRILCGEVKCLPPAGFDLGNSPAAFGRELHAGRVAFLSTTNGTKAVIAAQGAAHVLMGALTNASAVARKLAELGRPVTLLCAGTGGKVALEDVLGCGAVLNALLTFGAKFASDTALLAHQVFTAKRTRLGETMRRCTGGRNLIAAGMEADIDYCAQLDSVDLVGVARRDPLRVVLT